MTTIAYKDGMIASDTGAFRGNTVVSGIEKIARRDDGTLVGTCGHAGWAESFRAWVLAGEVGEKPPAQANENDTDAGLVIRPDGAIEVHESTGVLRLATSYYAMGAGRDQALGAMFAGASAEVAVAAAIAHDCFTAGEVRTLRR